MRAIPCPLCRGDKHRPKASKTRFGNTYHVVECIACGFMFVNPEPDSAELLRVYGQEYSEHHADVWHGHEDDLNRGVIARLKGIGVSSLVDLGAGQGRFVHMARKAGIDASGVEPAPPNWATAKERYGLDLERKSVDDYLAGKPTGLECVTILNVLEHLPDPVNALKGVLAALQPGGRLLVVVPNVDFTLTLGALRGAAGFQDAYMMESTRFSQQGFDPPFHLSSFDANHLKRAFELAGFTVKVMTNAPVIGATNKIQAMAKHGVAGLGAVLELLTGGRTVWGYSLLSVAQRPA